MILEMHCHTSEHSKCSHVSAVELVQRTFERGLHGIIFTDHHYLWSDEELNSLREASGVPDFFLLLSGQEVTTSDFGDVLVYGANRTIARKTPLTAIRDEFPISAIVWAHPYRKNRIPTEEELLYPLIDAVEIFSSNLSLSESNRGLEAWHRHKFTAIGGTDTHALSYTGTYPTLFDHPVTSIDDLAEEIRAGRCRPYFKEIPKLGTTRTQVREIHIGPATQREDREKLIVKTFDTKEEWDDAKRSFEILDALIRNGFDQGSCRVPVPKEKDGMKKVFIEQAVHGQTLFDMVLEAEADKTEEYLTRTARWLARYHNLELHITPREEFMDVEPERLNWYIKDIYRQGHRERNRIREILETVLHAERKICRERPERLIQSHGDFHPKNIFIGNDEPENPDTIFTAVIDFNSSFQQPRAFDVGTFLAQYRNQFFQEHEALKKAPEDIFLDAYLQYASDTEDDFTDQVELFRARTCLSILYYLNKVGMGDSENFWTVMVDAEHSLNRIAVHLQ